jgi:hypothetical protein
MAIGTCFALDEDRRRGGVMRSIADIAGPWKFDVNKLVEEIWTNNNESRQQGVRSPPLIAVSACHLCQLGPLGVGISQQPMHSDCNEDDEQRHDVGHEKYYPKPHVDPLTRADRQAIDDARCRHGSIG